MLGSTIILLLQYHTINNYYDAESYGYKKF